MGPSVDDGYLSVGTIGFEALAVEAIRDLKSESDVRIERLEAENAALRGTLDALATRLERIESAPGRTGETRGRALRAARGRYCCGGHRARAGSQCAALHAAIHADDRTLDRPRRAFFRARPTGASGQRR